MKKLVALLLLIFPCVAAYCLPVGNPADPILYGAGVFWDCYDPDIIRCVDYDWENKSVRFGYYGDFVYDRDLAFENFDKGFVHRSRIFTNAGFMAINFWDRFEVDVNIGASNVEFKSIASEFLLSSFPLGIIDIVSDTEFSWGIGVKGILWHYQDTFVGLDARYFSTKPNVKRIVFLDSTTLNPDENLRLRYREWQVGVGISRFINNFIPYFAIKWSRVKVNWDVNDPIPAFFEEPLNFTELVARHNWGYAIGVTMIAWQTMSLNVEARLRDENSISINAQIRL